MVGARGSLAYFPSLARTFGVGAFDVGGSRFATYLQSQYRGAEAFHTAWVDLRMEVAGSGVIGPLDEVADEAGQGGVVRLQHAITQQREQVEMRLVHQALLARPVEDPERIAYLAADRFSTQLVTAIPTPRRRASDAEFREMLCTYLALPSPCLRGLQGLRIADGQSYRSCDAHGHHLDCARLPGGGWDDQHDEVAETVLSRVYGSGIQGRREPRDVFAAVMPQDDLRARGDGLEAAGIIPDGIVRGVEFRPPHRPGAQQQQQRRPGGADVLVDFKMLHQGAAQYFTSREAQEQRAAAVAIRARAVDTDYRRAARERDERHHQVDRDAVRRGVTPSGPILALLRSYGTIIGLVFGAYAEASPAVHTLLTATAEHEARALWETMGARGYQEARASVMQALYAD